MHSIDSKAYTSLGKVNPVSPHQGPPLCMGSHLLPFLPPADDKTDHLTCRRTRLEPAHLTTGLQVEQGVSGSDASAGECLAPAFW